MDKELLAKASQKEIDRLFKQELKEYTKATNRQSIKALIIVSSLWLVMVIASFVVYKYQLYEVSKPGVVAMVTVPTSVVLRDGDDNPIYEV